MTASMVSCGIPWFFTKKSEYRVVRTERWNDILGGYRTIEKSDVRTSPFDIFGQCSSSDHVEGLEVGEVAVRDKVLNEGGQNRRVMRTHINGIWENASEAIISVFCACDAVFAVVWNWDDGRLSE